MVNQFEELAPREAMDFDVVIVGAGPAGLATAIRLKQRAAESGSDVSVVVVEKGSEVGAHILSGAVIDPIGLDRLLPEWRQDPDRPLKTEVTKDEFLFLTKAGGLRLPTVTLPKLMDNHGNFVGSLGNVCRYLGQKAEALGVEIYPGFPAAEVLTGDKGEVVGVATGDMGVAKTGGPKGEFTRGMELRAKYTILAEGARGSLTKQTIDRYDLNRTSDHQKYGLGVKELWQVRPDVFRSGLVQHSMGWPLPNKAGGGSWLYHFDDHLVSVGFVVHLNYENPTLSPFDEFQRFKTFPGGCLVGDSAGFVNVPRIKGSHNAILSGMLAAEHLFDAIGAGRAHDEGESYEGSWRGTDIGYDLYRVRNVKPLWSRFGTLVGIGLGGIDMWLSELTGLSPFGTLSHGKPDYATLKPAKKVKRIVYPRPDGVLTFDRLSSVFLSGTNHEEDQPVHLRVKDMDLQKRSEHDVYDGPSARYCPAAVYEWVEEGGDARYVINAQNCVHCKTCDIKDPNQNITWVTPEGGGGPNYAGM